MCRCARTLPQEIADYIIDHLADDWRALAACALIPSTQTGHARYLLCQTSTITLEGPTLDDLRDFLELCTPGSLLAQLPLSLHIRGDPSATSLYGYTKLPENLYLGHLQALRSLTLSHLDFVSPDRLRVLYTLTPRLQELSIHWLYMVDRPQGEQSAPSGEGEGVLTTQQRQQEFVSGPPHPVTAAPPHLLEAEADDSPISTPVAVFVSGDMLHTHPPMALHTLSLYLRGDVDPSPWTPIVAHSRKTLRTARIFVCSSLAAGEEAALYTAVGQCTGLRRLTLCISHHHGFGEAYLASLAAWLAPLPTYACARSVRELYLPMAVDQLWPDLADYIPAAGDAEGDFTGVFAREAYPSLEHLRVTLYYGPYRLYGPTPRPLAPTLGRETRALAKILGRISTAVKPLQDAGVKVEVGKQLRSTKGFKLEDFC